MAIFVSTPDRLAALLPWLNDGPQQPHRTNTAAILRFLDLVSPGAEYFGLSAEPEGPLTAQELEHVRQLVLRIVLGTLPDRRRGLPWMTEALEFPSLTFRASRGRQKGAASADSACVLTAIGRVRDIVPYAVLRLLSQPDAIMFSTCPAAAKQNGVCGRLLIASGKRRGRPAVYCSDLCRVRDWKIRLREQERSMRAPETARSKGGK